MYEFKSRVRYSEIDHRGTMTLPALINYFQDSSTFHSEEAGLGMEHLKEKKKAWVLSYWQVIVERYPKLGEEITVGTFATEFKGLYGNRNFYMKDSSGALTACANSIWVFMDLEKGRPARPEPEQIEPYGTHPPLSNGLPGMLSGGGECGQLLREGGSRIYFISDEEPEQECGTGADP